MSSFSEKVSQGLEVLHRRAEQFSSDHAGLKQNFDRLRADNEELRAKLDALTQHVDTEVHGGPVDALLTRMGVEASTPEPASQPEPVEAAAPEPVHAEFPLARNYAEPTGLEQPPQ